MTREQFKWGAFIAIILALMYVPTERCQYIGGSKRCVASKWQFFFDVAGLNQVDADRLMIQIVVVLVASVGLWLLVFKDKEPSGRGVRESADALPSQLNVHKASQTPSAPMLKTDTQTTNASWQKAKVFEPKKRREPVWLLMLGGAIVLGGFSIPVSIGLALFTTTQIGFLGYVFFAAFAAAVGACFGLIWGVLGVLRGKS